MTSQAQPDPHAAATAAAAPATQAAPGKSAQQGKAAAAQQAGQATQAVPKGSGKATTSKSTSSKAAPGKAAPGKSTPGKAAQAKAALAQPAAPAAAAVTEPQSPAAVAATEPEQLQASLHQNRQEITGLAREVADLRLEGDALQRDAKRQQGRLNALSSFTEGRGSASYDEVSTQVRETLVGAVEFAQQLEAQAQSIADQRENTSRLIAERIRLAAEREAGEIAERAQLDAHRLQADARARAAELVEQATTEARILRSEGELMLETELARYSELELEAERAIAARWVQSTADWERRAAVLAAELREAEDALRLIVADAETHRHDARLVAQATLEAARDEAGRIVAHAEAEASIARLKAERLLMSSAAKQSSLSTSLQRVRGMLREAIRPVERD